MDQRGLEIIYNKRLTVVVAQDGSSTRCLERAAGLFRARFPLHAEMETSIMYSIEQERWGRVGTRSAESSPRSTAEKGEKEEKERNSSNDRVVWIFLSESFC